MKKSLIIILIMLAFLAGGCSIFGKGNGGKKSGDNGAKDANLVDNGVKATSSVSGAAPETSADNPAAAVKGGARSAAIAEIVKYQYTEKYANPTYGFSFSYPKDFTVSEPPANGSEVILVQNIAKNIGAQILISPFDGEEIDLTAETIKADIPDLKISEEREVLIGANRKGLAFMSDNEAFGGASREVWFVFNGYLYQISTYAELDEFLKGLFGTWEFGK